MDITSGSARTRRYVRSAIGFALLLAEASCGGAAIVGDATTPDRRNEAGQRELDSGVAETGAPDAPPDTIAGDDGGAGEDAGAGDDAAPRTIGACAQLAPAGTWEDVSPLPGSMPMPENAGMWGAAAIVAHPMVDGTLYACVGYQGIWKSTDCGATWTKTSTGRNAAALDHGIQFETILLPGAGGQPDTLYVDNWIGSPPKFFRSTNGGVDWDALYDESSNVVESVGLDGWGNLFSLEPGSPRHIIADWHADCNPPFNPLCMGESTDSGATWRLFNGPRITDSKGALQGWQEAALPFFITSTTWIYASHAGIFSTTDSGSTWTMLRYPGATNHYQVGSTHYLTADDGVLSSTDGKTWTLLSGSHRSNTMVSTGTAIYTGDQFDSKGTLWTAPLSNPTSWTAVPMPTSGVNAGSVQLAYDPSHHLLYSANHRSGLWRMVVP